MMKKIFIVIIILSSMGAYPDDALLSQWGDLAESKNAGVLISWLKTRASKELGGAGCDDSGLRLSSGDARYPSFYGRLGIFITLVIDKKVRGCFGAFHHPSDRLEAVLLEYLKGALRYDHRYKPLGIEELKDAVIIVTITSMPYQVPELETLDISRCGVMVTYENGSSVLFVPAEMKTHSYLMRGIDKNAVSNIFAFRSVTIK